MKILVLADTHIPNAASDLPKIIYDHLADVDLILHAGDITEMNILDKLKERLPVVAVRGNMDTLEVRKILTQKEIVDVGRYRIGLIHGWGPPDVLQEVVIKEFLNDKVDVIVFGHLHRAINLRNNNILLFNPGSPTDKMFTKENSFGILEIDKSIKANIIKV